MYSQFRRILGTFAILTLMTAISALAGTSRELATPFGSSKPLVDRVTPGAVSAVSPAPNLTPDEMVAVLQAGADHIVAQQCADGGFGWPHADCSATYHNITAPILLGVLNAYTYTADSAHLAAAVAGGNFDLTYQYSNGEARFGGQTAYFMQVLSNQSGDSTYSTHAAQNFFDALQAGTYGPDDLNTAGFIAAVFAQRIGSSVNLRPWDFCTLVSSASALGNSGQSDAFAQAALDGLATLDNSDPANVYWDILGLAGGIMALSDAGWTSFPAISAPLHSGVNGVSSLDGLVGVLLSYQNADGSWYWHSNLAAPDVGDEDAQTTAYSVLALVAAESQVSGNVSEAIRQARDWLAGQQLASGGFPSYPGGTENTEVEGEILWSLGASAAYNVEDRAGIPAVGTGGVLVLVGLFSLVGILALRRSAS